MNLTGLLTEFYAYGFNYLDDSGAGTTRATAWLNASYKEICSLERWPWLEATATGTAPLTISDIDTLESVTDTTNVRKLAPMDRRNISDQYPDLTLPGAPMWYYTNSGSSVAVFPVTAVSLSVRYWKIPPDLSSGSDTPVVPATFHDVIVLGAVRRGLVDDQDAADYQQVVAEYGLRVETMRELYLYGQDADRPGYVAQVAGHEGF